MSNSTNNNSNILNLNNGVSMSKIKFIKLETVATAATDLAPEKRFAHVQDGWHVCNTCRHPVSFGFVNTKAAEVIASQNISGISFIKREVSIFGDEGFGAVFCRDCYTQAGYKKMNGRKFKKMSDSWVKKQARGF